MSRRFWNDLAGSEFLERIAFSRFASKFLVDLATPYLKSDGSILDYGAGDNLYLVRELVSRGYIVAALEPNAAVRDRNLDLFRSQNFKGTIGKVPKASFDCIFLSEVIEHLSDAALSRVLHTVATGLKPAGTLVITTPDNENLLDTSRYCPTCRQLFHPWGHVRSFSAATLEEVLLGFGFDCGELRSVDFSSNREAAIELEATRSAVRSMAARLGSVAEGIDTTASEAHWAAAEALRGASSNLGKLAGPEPGGNPKRQNIGAGGTLFAVAKLR